MYQWSKLNQVSSLHSWWEDWPLMNRYLNPFVAGTPWVEVAIWLHICTTIAATISGWKRLYIYIFIFSIFVRFFMTPLTLLYTGFFDDRTTQGRGSNWPPHIISSVTLLLSAKYIQKNNKSFCDFSLFFYDVIIFDWNFDEFPRSGNLVILKRCHIL